MVHTSKYAAIFLYLRRIPSRKYFSQVGVLMGTVTGNSYLKHFTEICKLLYHHI